MNIPYSNNVCTALLKSNNMNRKKNKSLEEANLHFWLPTKERGTGPHIDAESWVNEAEHHATAMNHGPETCRRK